MTTEIRAEVPERLWQQAQSMVEQGLASDIGSLVTESLRRYIDSHQDIVMERIILNDVRWGLCGRD
jgi:hypothetical protein